MRSSHAHSSGRSTGVQCPHLGSTTTRTERARCSFSAIERTACGGATTSSSPVLLVTGDEDIVAPPQAVRVMAEKLYRARSMRVVVLPKCGHWTPVERPEECARELRTFLDANR